jgi:hypothetical protein
VSPEKIKKHFGQMIMRGKIIEQSSREKKIGDFEQCTIGKGMYAIMILTIYQIAQRYHDVFNLPQFLWCFVQCSDFTTQNVNALGNQLILSRLNFILNDAYLPIISTYSGDNHTTSTLFIPIVSDDDDHHDHRPHHHDRPHHYVEWFIIYINTNGSESFKHRHTDDYHRAIQQLQEFMRPQVNYSFKVLYSKCDNNIQQIFPTCVSWSFFLTLFMLSKIQFFYQRSRSDGDFIHQFCRHLSRRNRNTQTIDKFHEFIDDLQTSFMFLTIDILQRASSFDLQHYIHFIQTGNPNPRMLLLCERIFEATEGAMNHLAKHLNKMQFKIDSTDSLLRRI